MMHRYKEDQFDLSMPLCNLTSQSMELSASLKFDSISWATIYRLLNWLMIMKTLNETLSMAFSSFSTIKTKQFSQTNDR